MSEPIHQDQQPAIPFQLERPATAKIEQGELIVTIEGATPRVFKVTLRAMGGKRSMIYQNLIRRWLRF